MTLSQQQLNVGAAYNVITTYIPADSDELPITAGDVVEVQQTFADGEIFIDFKKWPSANLQGHIAGRMESCPQTRHQATRPNS
jgi:hypothetical protein